MLAGARASACANPEVTWTQKSETSEAMQIQGTFKG